LNFLKPSTTIVFHTKITLNGKDIDPESEKVIKNIREAGKELNKMNEDMFKTIRSIIKDLEEL